MSQGGVVGLGGMTDDVKLPRHINMKIEHQPHALSYQSVDKWLALNRDMLDAVDVTDEDAAAMRETGEIWVMTWHPNTPVGSYSVAAATLDRVFEIVGGSHWP